MRKVRRALRGLAFLCISLAMVLGLGFGFTKRDAVKVRAADKSFTTEFYRLTYSGNEITLLLNADISVYQNLAQSDISGLKNSLVETLQEALSDDIDLDSLVSHQPNGLKVLPKLAPIDTSTVENIVTSLLEDVESVDNAVADSGTYDKMLSYYVDRYVASYVAANNITNPAEIANVYQEVATSITTALQNRVTAIYEQAGASPEETAAALQEVSDKVETVVTEVKDLNDNGENVTVDLADVTDIVNSITNADANTISNVTDLIQELAVEDELKDVVTSSTSEELTDFFNNVNMDVIIEVVSSTSIDKDDVVDIINTIGADNLVEVANNVGVDALKDLAQSVNLTTEELQDIIVDNMSNISFSTLTKLIEEITLDGIVVFKDGGLVNSGLKQIIKDLPKPNEIASYTDSQMRLSYDVVISTTYGDVDFDLTVGFFGDCSNIRRVASAIDNLIDVNVENGVYNVTLTAPKGTDNLLLYLSDTAAISDELKLEVFDNAFLTLEEFYNSIDVAEYVRMFRDIDYQTIVDTFTSADELNQIFETDRFTESRIRTLVNDLNTLVARLANVSYDDLVNLINKFTSNNPLDNNGIESKVNQLQDFLQRLADKDIDYDLLREFAENGTGLDFDTALANIQNDQAKLDRLQKLLDKVYNVLPESLKQTSILDLYQGDGLYTLQDTYTLDYQNILTQIFGSNGTTLYNKLSGLFDSLPSSINLNLNATLNDVYKITYHYDATTTKFGLLPVGADVAFYGEDDELTWMLADGTAVDDMISADIDVYPVPEAVINDNVSPLEFVYDGQDHEIASEVTPDGAYTYTYQWTKDGVDVEGATAATLNVKNVADSGTYVLEVTATEINYTFESNEVVVNISKQQVDVSGLTWDYDELTPFTYDGQEHTVALEDVPATITVAYADAAKTNAGSYTAVATPTLVDAENYELVGTIANCAWEIKKAQLDLSGLTWNYDPATPFTYDGQEHTVAITEFPAGVNATYANAAATNAGSYIAVATPLLDDPDNYEVSGAIPNLEWKINKAVVDLSALAWNYADAFLYDGQEHSVALNNVPATITVNYTDAAKTNAGNYTAKAQATLVDAANYELSGSIADCAWVINKVVVDLSTLTWNYTNAFLYDGQEHSVALNNVPATITVNYTDAAKTAAGNYTAKAQATLVDAANYELSGSIADCAWVINKVVIDLSGINWDYTAAIAYDGQEHTITLSDNVEHVTFAYTGNTATIAGSYIAHVDVTPDANYEVTGTIADLNWEISKVVVDLSTLTWNYAEAFTYDGQEHTVALNNVPATITVNYTDAAKTAAGNYTAKAQATLVDAANYELSGTIADCAWVINKVVINLAGINWDYTAAIAYDGQEHVIELDANVEHVTFAYTGNKATNAGSYTAHVNVTPDANYEVTGTIADLNWEIAKAVVDVSGLAWNYSEPFEYDGQVKTVTLNNVPATVTVTYTGNTATEVGNYTATVSFAAADANHEVSGSVDPLNWEIKAAAVEETTVLEVKDANGNVIAEVTILNGTFPDDYTLQSDPQAFDDSIDFSSILDKNQEVGGGQIFDLYFNDDGTRTGISADQGYRFKVRLAIPSDLLDYPDDKLRVVFIDNGEIKEEFEFNRVGNYVEFETTHFSMYAVLGIRDVAPNLWWLWLLLGLLVIIIVIILLLLLKKKYSVIELYKESGKIFVDGKEVPVDEEFDTIELFKETGKIFVNGNELDDEDNTPEPPAGEFEVVELFKESGEIFVNGNKESDEEVFELDKNSGDLLLNKQEYDFYNNLNHSFKARLIRTHDEIKQYYSDIKNDILSYKLGGKKEISNRLSWRHETFNIGREGLVEFKMRRTALVVYLPLNASDYVDTKYKVEKAGENLCKFVIKNDRRCKYAKDLIAVVMERQGLVKVEREAVDYTADLQNKSVNELIKEGLIKE